MFSVKEIQNVIFTFNPSLPLIRMQTKGNCSLDTKHALLPMMFNRRWYIVYALTEIAVDPFVPVISSVEGCLSSVIRKRGIIEEIVVVWITYQW